MANSEYRPGVNGEDVASNRDTSGNFGRESVGISVKEVREIEVPQDPNVLLPERDWQKLKGYLALLKDRDNRHHFTGIVKQTPTGKDTISIDDLLHQLRDPAVHWMEFAGQNEESLGFAIVRDPNPGQNDTWVEKIVIRNEHQNKRRGGAGTSHIGINGLEFLKDYIYGKPDYTGRPRTIIRAAVVMYVPGSERSEGAFKGAHFALGERMANQAEVLLPSNQFVTRDVQRFSHNRQQWEFERSARGITPPQPPSSI